MTAGMVRAAGLIGLTPAELAQFSTTNRFVQRFAVYPECEVLIVGWEPGQVSSYHDHGASQSVVTLVQGRMIARNDDGTLILETGGVLITPVGVKHQMHNPGPGRAVTVHIYAPPVPGTVSDPFVDHDKQPHI